MATIFARLSANRYDEALVAQGAIPCLLAMLCVQDPNHPEFCKRVRYKAAICIGTIASRSYGLKAVHDSKGYYALSEVLRLEKGKKNPVGMICSSLMSRLEGKYQLETVV
uniref:Uncharacterized protein n=1 Tax=Plectus sambesii TaxID=2011161 RepID=A0A914VZR3_9BILA